MINKYSLGLIVFLCTFVSGFGQAVLPTSRTTWNGAAPTGWTDSGTGSYATIFACSTTNGGRMDTTGDYYQVYFDSAPDQLSYQIKLTGVSASSLLVEESPDGVSWSTVVNNTSITTGCTFFSYTLISTSRYVRWTYTKVSTVNLTIDDVSITKIICSDAVDWANIWPNTSPQNIMHGGVFDVYTQAYEGGVTDADPFAAGAGLNAWIGYSSTNNAPSSPGWTWIPAPYNVDVGNNDEFTAEIGSSLAPGTYYYASRFELNNCSYVYGGTGGLWNNDSVELIVTPDQVNFCNVEFPKIGTITAGDPFTVYTQAYEPGVTDAVGQGAAITSVEIGYNTISEDYEPWNPIGWTWVSAAYNPACLDCNGIQNDEYMAEIGSALPIGTYYYASRWQLNGSSYSYGGIFDDNLGNFWDPITYNNGILTVTNAPCSDLIISEYVEGTSNNKYIELFNGTGSNVNLANYELRLYSNGSSSISASQPLSGILANGATIVYKNSLATIYSGAAIVLPNASPINFNGDDAFALAHSGVNIDIIGQIGFDPGAEWIGGSVSTLNRTLRRKSSVQVGDSNGSDAFSPNVEWLSFPVNSVSELGYHFNGCFPDKELQLELPIGTVVYCGHDYEFGTQVINTNTDVVLRIRNLGSVDLNITSLALTTGAQYTLVSPPATPFIIPGTSFVDITIRFNPNALGLFLDTLTIGSDDASESSCTIDLSGIGVSNCDTTTEIIAAQDFESSSSDTWSYTAVHAALSPYWDVTTSLTDITSAQNGTHFWGITDLERSGHTNQTHELSFDYNITAYSNVTFSFQYYTYGIDVSDSFDYQLFYNGIPQGIVDISGNTNAWTEVLTNIPNSVNMMQIVFYVDIDSALDNAGLDNFVLSSTIQNTATWDGAHWNWNEGTAMDTLPSSSTTVVLAGNYDTGSFGSFNACQLYINPTYTLDVNNSTYVEVENFATINGTIRVQTHGAFVQRADFNNGFVLNPGGSASVLKSTSIINNWYDYTYWSSPVSGTTVGAALNIAPANRRFFFDAVNYLDVYAETNNDGNLVFGFHDDIDDNNDDWIVAPAGMSMAPGQGFATTVFSSGMFPGTRQVTFNGPYNTGTITTPIFYNGPNGDNDWNLIGNPYPCAISFNDLYDDNSTFIDGAAYLWSHATDASNGNNGNQAQNFDTDDYAIINRFSGNIAGNSGVQPHPGNYIPSGQSFFVKGLSGGVVTFNNDMRMANTFSNDQFFRTGTPQPNRLWINLTSNNGVFNQILVAYVDGGTDGDDGMAYDATRNLSTGAASILYTLIDGADGKKYAIQGKNPVGLTLDETIPIGFYTSITQPTNYKLSIADFQGEFLTANTIYLKDNLLNVTFNLSTSDYMFSSQTGEFNSRFEIVFRDEVLSVLENEISPNELSIIELADGRVKFSVGNNLDITSVEILDMLGRTLYNLKGNSSTEVYELSGLSQAAYMAKVTLSNGQVITKRAVKRK